MRKKDTKRLRNQLEKTHRLAGWLAGWQVCLTEAVQCSAVQYSAVHGDTLHCVTPFWFLKVTSSIFSPLSRPSCPIPFPSLNSPSILYSASHLRCHSHVRQEEKTVLAKSANVREEEGKEGRVDERQKGRREGENRRLTYPRLYVHYVMFCFSFDSLLS